MVANEGENIGTVMIIGLMPTDMSTIIESERELDDIIRAAGLVDKNAEVKKE